MGSHKYPPPPPHSLPLAPLTWGADGGHGAAVGFGGHALLQQRGLSHLRPLLSKGLAGLREGEGGWGVLQGAGRGEEGEGEGGLSGLGVAEQTNRAATDNLSEGEEVLLLTGYGPPVAVQDAVARGSEGAVEGGELGLQLPAQVGQRMLQVTEYEAKGDAGMTLSNEAQTRLWIGETNRDHTGILPEHLSRRNRKEERK